jgi:hypothetical protein
MLALTFRFLHTVQPLLDLEWEILKPRVRLGFWGQKAVGEELHVCMVEGEFCADSGLIVSMA